MSKSIALALIASGQSLLAATETEIMAADAAFNAASAASLGAQERLQLAQTEADAAKMALDAAGAKVGDLRAKSAAITEALRQADNAGNLFDAEMALRDGELPDLANQVRAQAEANLSAAQAVIPAGPPVEPMPSNPAANG